MKNYKYYTAHVKVKGEVAHSVGSSVSRRLEKLAGRLYWCYHVCRDVVVVDQRRRSL